MADHHPGHQHDDGLAVEESKPKVKPPPLYKVILLNDDYTPMEFVVWILIKVFHKPHDEAQRLMLQVHTSGRGVCGVFPHDVARTKVYQVQMLAEQNEHPLQSVMEAVGGDEESE